MFGIFRSNPIFIGIAFITAIFIEIASIIVVGRIIGVFPTLGLLLLAIIIGFALLRMQSANFMMTIQSSLSSGRSPTDEMASSAILICAAILFIIPGFVGDTIALLLLFPPVRASLLFLFAKHFKISTPHKSKERNIDNTIDLNANEYHSADPENSPWRNNESKQLPDNKNNKKH